MSDEDIAKEQAEVGFDYWLADNIYRQQNPDWNDSDD
jgi:hypothetical protein